MPDVRASKLRRARVRPVKVAICSAKPGLSWLLEAGWTLNELLAAGHALRGLSAETLRDPEHVKSALNRATERQRMAAFELDPVRWRTVRGEMDRIQLDALRNYVTGEPMLTRWLLERQDRTPGSILKTTLVFCAECRVQIGHLDPVYDVLEPYTDEADCELCGAPGVPPAHGETGHGHERNKRTRTSAPPAEGAAEPEPHYSETRTKAAKSTGSPSK